MISFGALEILLMFAVFIGSLFLGRFTKTRSGSFLPNEPISVLFCILLVAAGVTAWITGLPSITLIIIGIAAGGFMLGYPLGDFSRRGIVEFSVGKVIELNAYSIAYYYNHDLESYCLSDYQGQKFRNKVRRIFFNIHETIDFPMDKIQARTHVSVDNTWWKLHVSGAMTYVVKKEERILERKGKKIKYTHRTFIPADITQLGPYDFFMRTELYLVALDIANEANALRLKADIESKKSAAEGGATIVSAITKLDPADAAANLNELKHFIATDNKTTEEPKIETPADEPKNEKRWWQIWRRKKTR